MSDQPPAYRPVSVFAFVAAATALGRLTAMRCAVRKHPLENSPEVSRGVFHEFLVQGLRAAADFIGHGIQHGLAVAFFIPKFLNARHNHRAHRCKSVPLHRRLWEGMVFVDK